MPALLAELPALPLHEAGKYVAGAYVVLFALVLIYVAIMAIRLSHIESELSELLSLAETRQEQPREGEQPSDDDGGERSAQRESTPAYPAKGHM